MMEGSKWPLYCWVVNIIDPYQVMKPLTFMSIMPNLFPIYSIRNKIHSQAKKNYTRPSTFKKQI